MRTMLLSEMLDELRAEARISQNAAHAVQMTDPHKKLLRRVQEELYLAYDWPGLKVTQSVAVPAGTRYSAYPDKITFEGIEQVYARDGSTVIRLLTYGIGIDEFNAFDSDQDERSFPVRRWQNYLSLDAEQLAQNMFEIWPVPDRDVTIVFRGKRALFPLVEANHTSTLDGPLIVLNAAAEILAAQKAEDASLKLQRAKDRLGLLKLRQVSGDNRPFNLAGTPSRPTPRPGIDYIPR